MARFCLTAADFKAAQVDFVPLSLRDVPLQKSTVEWADIGGARKPGTCFLPQVNRALGLAETRRVLRETLEWPTKYAAIFAQSPLRLRSGYVGRPLFGLFVVPNHPPQAFALRIPRVWEDAARLDSCEGMRLEFHQHQRP
jgi:hypothetical protein